MKKLLIISFILLTTFLSENKIYAAGQIELDQVPDTINLVVGQEVKKYFSFYYSGTEYTPSASFSSRSGFPQGLKLSRPIYEGNGLYNILYSGIPENTGNYILTLTITDNYGVFVNKKINVNIVGLTFNNLQLKDEVFGIDKQYIQKIEYSYPGKGDLRLRLSNFSDGLLNSNTNPNSGNDSFTIKLVSSKAGKFTFNADVFLDSFLVGSGVFNLNVNSDTVNNYYKEPVKKVLLENNNISFLNKSKVDKKEELKQDILPTKDITTKEELPINVEIIPQKIEKIKWYKKILNLFIKNK